MPDDPVARLVARSRAETSELVDIETLCDLVEAGADLVADAIEGPDDHPHCLNCNKFGTPALNHRVYCTVGAWTRIVARLKETANV